MKKEDLKNLKPYKNAPKMTDPIRFPKILGAIEQESKDSYEIQLNKMVVDITRKLVEFKK